MDIQPNPTRLPSLVYTCEQQPQNSHLPAAFSEIWLRAFPFPADFAGPKGSSPKIGAGGAQHGNSKPRRRMMQRGDDGGGAAPTGCFKCGRPGHWSRDCPSSSTANPNPGSNSSSKFPQGSKRPFPEKDKAAGTSSSNPAASSKKVPRTRPKLTPDLLLSDDGLGYVLRHFPRSFKYRGRGHEVCVGWC